ncbi:hypothetical protein E05_16510 [Plautia stali symbiont]|nr:hypothetical protein E05_16510 [Plautia stali symbiont]
MFIKVLGSAASGGFPQWNCNCANCSGLRNGTIQAQARTQSSIIVSDNDTDWVLCNASPDISQQIARTPELVKHGVLRGTAIGSIILTDSQIDHTTGLLSLREGCPHQVWCTPEVHADLTSGFPIFTMLQHWNGGLLHRALTPFRVDVCASLQFTAIPILSNAPPYSPYRARPLPGHNVALFIENTASGQTLLYAPGFGAEDVVLLRGDWTQPDPAIGEFLRRRDRVAIPFNQIYGPALPHGQILSPLLSRDAVISTLSEAKK